MYLSTRPIIFFRDVRSPWQSGLDENINGLLGRYLPKGEDLEKYSVEDTEKIRKSLIGRPRKTTWL